MAKTIMASFGIGTDSKARVDQRPSFIPVMLVAEDGTVQQATRRPELLRIVIIEGQRGAIRLPMSRHRPGASHMRSMRRGA